MKSESNKSIAGSYQGQQSLSIGIKVKKNISWNFKFQNCEFLKRD